MSKQPNMRKNIYTPKLNLWKLFLVEETESKTACHEAQHSQASSPNFIFLGSRKILMEKPLID